ncbi:MAG: 30S ribosome-binding factor RbfA [Eubacteriales bacterium]|nr:30S ribosome-binding factor RbfA [Eubacteriales bacterium]
MANNRIDRISAEYHRAMAEALRTVKDPRVSGMTSVTRCEVTGDLRYAKVYISVLGGDEKEALRGLKSAAGYLRHAVGEKLQLRASPEPVFHMDDSIRYGAQILEKLHEIEGKQGE